MGGAQGLRARCGVSGVGYEEVGSAGTVLYWSIIALV